jgi:hypothetical protein
MVKIEVCCDKCHTVITADRTKLVIDTGPLRTIHINGNGEAIIDLCPRCAEALLAWLRASGSRD